MFIKTEKNISYPLCLFCLIKGIFIQIFLGSSVRKLKIFPRRVFVIWFTVRKEVSVLENERNTHDSILYLKQNKTKQTKLTVVNFRSYFILFALQNHLLIYLK